MVQDRLNELGTTAITAAEQAGLPRDAIRYVIRGHAPSLERANDICTALGMELMIMTPGHNAEPVPSNTESPATQNPTPIDEGLLADIIYGLIINAAEDGAILRYDQIASDAAHIYATERVKNGGKPFKAGPRQSKT